MNAPTMGFDTSVKMPKAVLDAAARSDALVNQINGVEPTEETQPQVTVESNQPAEQPVEVQQTAEQVNESKIKNGSLEQQLSAMKGRYERSQDQIRQMGEQITNLQTVIAAMKSAPAVEIPELQAERLISDDEAREYGDDFLKVVGKKAREELTPIIKGYEAKIAELETRLGNVQGTIQQSQSKNITSELDTKLPAWREINRDQDFLSWLALPDPFSGVIRHELLSEAYSQGDTGRVLRFFNGFLAEEAAVDPTREVPDASETRVPKVPLQNLAAPGRAKTAAAPNTAPAEKPVISRASIAAFYTDVANGKYRGRDAEKNSREAEIHRAAAEGRIR